MSYPRTISISIFDNFRQIILHGPPGTSKTYQAKRMAAKLILDKTDKEVNNLVSEEEKSGSGEFSEKRFKIIREQNRIDRYEGQWAIVQFHPAYNYEDFVRGIQVSGQGKEIRYDNVQRIFSAMCKAAEKDSGKKYVLIIDEINRAHIAAVLGELIYGLEYRKARITTPYAIEGDDTLSVPDNLYIIGTMNTADRSIGHIDYAVRRRFAFVACLPDSDALTHYYSGKEAMGKLAKLLFEAVRSIFNKDNLNEFDAEDVCPGHTYFMAEDKPKLLKKFIYQVYPLLREYYKDGIFRQNVTQLKLPNNNMVPLNQAVPPDELHRLLDRLQGPGDPPDRPEPPPVPAVAVRPEFEAVLTAWNQGVTPELRTTGNKPDYRQVRPPRWPLLVHYEFGDWDQDQQMLAIELHAEGRPYSTNMRPEFERLAQELRNRFPSLTYRPKGPLSLCLEVDISDPERAVDTMKDLISATRARVTTLLRLDP